MSCVYIIKLTKNDTSNLNAVEAFLELSTTKNKQPYLEVRTRENPSDLANQILLYKYISKNFAEVSFSDDNYKCSIKYVDRIRIEYNATFHFDSQSASAYLHFKKIFSEMINTTIETINYPNGYIYYLGEVLIDKNNNRKPNGFGTLYYNNTMRTNKYNGEFENGEYDGAGEFVSNDYKISIKANNISNGVPTQNGMLLIKLSKLTKSVDINFNNLFELLGMKNKNEKQDFVKSDNFVRKVAELYWDHEESIQSTMFRENTIDDKQQELWNQLQGLNNKVDKLLKLNYEDDSVDINNTDNTHSAANFNGMKLNHLNNKVDKLLKLNYEDDSVDINNTDNTHSAANFNGMKLGFKKNNTYSKKYSSTFTEYFPIVYFVILLGTFGMGYYIKN